MHSAKKNFLSYSCNTGLHFVTSSSFSLILFYTGLMERNSGSCGFLFFGFDFIDTLPTVKIGKRLPAVCRGY
jgi:hypothetical protein